MSTQPSSSQQRMLQQAQTALQRLPFPDQHVLTLVVLGAHPHRYDLQEVAPGEHLGEFHFWDSAADLQLLETRGKAGRLEPTCRCSLHVLDGEKVQGVWQQAQQVLLAPANVKFAVPDGIPCILWLGGQQVHWRAGESSTLDRLAAGIEGLFDHSWEHSLFLPVLEHDRGIRFRVDAVEPALRPLPPSRVLPVLRRSLEAQVLATSFDPEQQGVGAYQHGLVQSIHTAFSQHYPLELCPDSLWITLSQGLAVHIQQNAATLRNKLVTHQGKKKLVIETLEGFDPDRSIEGWEQRVQAWSSMVEDEVRDQQASLFLCDFSTTTPTVRTVSQVVMMDGFREYFEYIEACICGIPEITLRGTVQDWMHFRDKVQKLDTLGLSGWKGHLLPLCEQFILTAQGHPSRHFWQAIYKPRTVYGGELVTGWIKLFFLYLGSVAAPYQNSMLEKQFQGFVSEDSIPSRSLPDGLSRVPIKVLETRPDGKQVTHPLQLVAGVVGATQDQQTWTIKPLLGWGVARLSLEATGNTENHQKSTPLFQQDALLALGLGPQTVSDLAELGKKKRLGGFYPWGFELVYPIKVGDLVLVGRNTEQTLLVSSTGEVFVGDARGANPVKANSSLQHFETCLDIHNRFFDGDRPPVTLEQVGVLELLEDIEALFQRRVPEALQEPDGFWRRQLLARGWVLRS